MYTRIYFFCFSLMLLGLLSWKGFAPTNSPQVLTQHKPPDTLDVEAFKALFMYQGPGLFPDSLERVDCPFIISASQGFWDHRTLPDWEQYRLAYQGKVLALPLYGLPYSLAERPQGGYFATFYFVEGEVSNQFSLKVLDENFLVMPEGEDIYLSYCGGDAGYEWYRDGHFVNDSVYVFRSIMYDAEYDTTWGSFVWDHQGRQRVYPFDVSPYLGKEIPWLELAEAYFPIKDSLVLKIDSTLEQKQQEPLAPAFCRELLLAACYEENAKQGNDPGANSRLSEDEFFKVVCRFREVRPISFVKTKEGAYYLSFWENVRISPSLWIAGFGKDGNYQGHALIRRYEEWNRQTYCDLQDNKLTITHLQRGAWVDPDTIRQQYYLTPDGKLELEKEETLIKPNPDPRD